MKLATTLEEWESGEFVLQTVPLNRMTGMHLLNREKLDNPYLEANYR
jgi:hypothetical protein